MERKGVAAKAAVAADARLSAASGPAERGPLRGAAAWASRGSAELIARRNQKSFLGVRVLLFVFAPPRLATLPKEKTNLKLPPYFEPRPPRKLH